MKLFKRLILNTEGSFLCAVTGDVLSEFNNDAVVNNAVNGGSSGQGVFEDLIPLRENEIGSDDDTAAFISFGEQGEEHLHLITGLLDVADVIEDQNLKAVEAAKLLLEKQITFRAQEIIDETEGGREEHAASGVNELMSNGSSKMSFATPGQTKDE
jgi:hypothetical protein